MLCARRLLFNYERRAIRRGAFTVMSCCAQNFIVGAPFLKGELSCAVKRSKTEGFCFKLIHLVVILSEGRQPIVERILSG